MQYLTRFNKINRHVCPRQAIMYDLRTEMLKWKEDGDQIITMGNAYVESKYITDLFDKLGMRELIIKRHGKTITDTTIGNRLGQAIYGIWVTRGVNIIAGGYFPYI